MRTAITGGIAEGKSTVLRMLAERGHRVASADEAARATFRDPETNASLAAIIGAEPPISGAELAAAIAEATGRGDDSIRRRVNAAMHPAIRARVDLEAAEFDEVPLLLEACLQGRYDEVWVVTCSPETKMARLRARYGDEGFGAIAETQLPGVVRRTFADRVLPTDGTLEETERRVEEALLHREKNRGENRDGRAE